MNFFSIPISTPSLVGEDKTTDTNPWHRSAPGPMKTAKTAKKPTTFTATKSVFLER
mgnify:CR=1 FL=1